MGRTKNVLLSLGIGFGVLWFVYSIVATVITIIKSSDVYKFQLTNIFLILFAVIAIIILPILLLISDIRNKPTKLCSTLTIALNVFFTTILLTKSFTFSAPQYLVISKLGMVQVYLTLFVSFLKSGGMLALISSVLIIIGAIISLKER